METAEQLEREIEARKKAEAQLLLVTRQLEVASQMHRRIMEYSMDVICTIDAQARFIEIGAACEKVWGYAPEELAGRPYMDLVHPDDRAKTTEEAHDILTGRPAGSFENRYLHKNGTVVYTTWSAYWSDAEQVMICVAKDTTARRWAEDARNATLAELSRSNAELEQLAYVASHDLQEPLRAVAGVVQILQRRYQGQLDARADELIGHAVDGATRMQTLINDLLRYSRVGTRIDMLQPVDCAALLQNVLGDLAVSIKERKAVVSCDALPVVMGEAGQLSQVFQNLLSNAIKFHGEQAPQIHVRATRVQDEWVFSVRDNGIGMKAEYFERIFVLFQRLHTRQEHPGTGIGLAVCKKIVERHGGRIWVESEPGCGSTFSFSIPALK